MNAPRIGIDARMWRHTGIGRYVSNLVPRLPARGLDVVAWVPPDAVPDWPGVDVRPCAAPLFSLREQLAFRDARLDLFHVPHLNAPLALRVPLVVTLHDLIPLRHPGTIASPLGLAYFRLMATLAPRRARATIAVSGATRADLVALAHAPAGRITVIPQGADPRFAEPSGLPRPLAGPYVLYTGQWKRYKNLEVLLDGFARLARPGLKLVLAGRVDPGSPHVPAAIARLGLGDAVVTTGWIASEAELVAWYQHAAAFAFPSRLEGFGLPPLEAMAAGVPVVASDAPGLAETVTDAALIAPADDPAAWAAALARVLDDEALRARLIAAGRDRVAELTWERTADATAAVYRRVLE